MHVVPIFEYKKVIPELEYQKPPKKWWQIRDRYTFQTQYYERKNRAYDVYSEFYEIDLYFHDGLSKMIFKKNPYEVNGKLNEQREFKFFRLFRISKTFALMQ